MFFLGWDGFHPHVWRLHQSLVLFDHFHFSFCQFLLACLVLDNKSVDLKCSSKKYIKFAFHCSQKRSFSIYYHGQTLNIISKKSFRPNVEVVTDEKLPNRLTGPYRRQIHCPRLRKHKDYLNYSCKRQKNFLEEYWWTFEKVMEKKLD